MDDQDNELEWHAKMADRVILVLLIAFSVATAVLWIKEILKWLL